MVGLALTSLRNLSIRQSPCVLTCSLPRACPHKSLTWTNQLREIIDSVLADVIFDRKLTQLRLALNLRIDLSLLRSALARILGLELVKLKLSISADDSWSIMRSYHVAAVLSRVWHRLSIGLYNSLLLLSKYIVLALSSCCCSLASTRMSTLAPSFVCTARFLKLVNVGL